MRTGARIKAAVEALDEVLNRQDRRLKAAQYHGLPCGVGVRDTFAMKTGTALALVGVALALVDVTGLARFVDVTVRKAMGPLRIWARAMTEQNTLLQRLLGLAGMALFALFVILALVEWLFGFSIVPEVTMADGTRRNALFVVANMLWSVGALLVGLGLLAFCLWWVLWMLAWPRKGIVSGLGFALAVVALGYELLQ